MNNRGAERVISISNKEIASDKEQQAFTEAEMMRTKYEGSGCGGVWSRRWLGNVELYALLFQGKQSF
jgi:hypothetical protein